MHWLVSHIIPAVPSDVKRLMAYEKQLVKRMNLAATFGNLKTTRQVSNAHSNYLLKSALRLEPSGILIDHKHILHPDKQFNETYQRVRSGHQPTDLLQPNNEPRRDTLGVESQEQVRRSSLYYDMEDENESPPNDQIRRRRSSLDPKNLMELGVEEVTRKKSAPISRKLKTSASLSPYGSSQIISKPEEQMLYTQSEIKVKGQKQDRADFVEQLTAKPSARNARGSSQRVSSARLSQAHPHYLQADDTIAPVETELKNSDASPKRKHSHKKDDSDVSPKRKHARKKDDSDVSPKRKHTRNKDDSDESPTPKHGRIV